MIGIRPSVSALALAAGLAALPNPASAQAPPLVDVCSGLSVNLPVLQPVAGAASGLLAGLLDPVLNGIVGDINVNLRNALSGQNLGLRIVDQNGNILTAPPSCALKTGGVTVTTPGGISIGGGAITGLGSPSSLAASAPDQDAIALGNGASALAGTSGGVAIGLRGTVASLDGVAIGRDATVTANGGVALGAGSVASRAGLSGAPEAFTGTAVGSTMGALSVGAAGGERQIANVAGGTANTDAVNVRQLKAVGNGLAGAIGGGAGFDGTTGLFTGPSFALRGTVYTDVGSALAALDTAIGPGGPGPASGIIAANNTSNNPAAAASGSDALSAGYGSAATGSNATALGTLARADGPNSVSVGANASAGGNGSIALGQGASAQPSGAVAIGNGAIATRVNQVAIGSAASTYTLRGIASEASRAAQSGPIQIVTTDGSGNLASTTFDPRGIDQRLGALGQDVTALRGYAVETRKEARQGIAAAMAMTGASMPSAPGRTSWSGNTSVFKGEWAAGVAVAHRLNVAIPIAISAGASWNATSFGGARFGVSGEF